MNWTDPLKGIDFSKSIANKLSNVSWVKPVLEDEKIARAIKYNPAFIDQVVRFREYAIELDAILLRVSERGGIAAPWQVDLKEMVATLGPIRISFYRLTNDSFSPAMYTRSDCQSDVDRDRHLIEDAFSCIATKLRLEGWPTE